VGTFVLFKASLELLKASSPSPKFVVISSQAGGIEIGGSMPISNLPYGLSKAAVNFLARKLHTDHASDGLSELCDDLMCNKVSSHHILTSVVVFPICPGAVDTDMGKSQLPCILLLIWPNLVFSAQEFRKRLEGNPGGFEFKSVDDTVKYLLQVVDNATRDGQGGKFMNFDGKVNPW
jgi:NAD(P)-dependent dehydrogenase (short-subunit alcohol dehydrogenase family)